VLRPQILHLFPLLLRMFFFVRVAEPDDDSDRVGGTSFGLWRSILLDGLPSERTYTSSSAFDKISEPRVFRITRATFDPPPCARIPSLSSSPWPSVPPSRRCRRGPPPPPVVRRHVLRRRVPLLACVGRAARLAAFATNLPCVVFFDGGFPEGERAFRLPREY
jgi:hypothetical protein